MRRLLKPFFGVTATAVFVAAMIAIKPDVPAQKSIKMAQVPPVPVVAAVDLASAGFSDPVPLAPANGRFSAPVKYFRVKESAVGSAWKNEGAADVVAVSVVTTPYSAEAVTRWQNVYADISGRAKVCASRPGIYYCCVGPDRNKCEKLVVALRGN
jgi:hypothetical protein